MRKNSRLFTLAQMIGDAIVINIATYAAWFIRYDVFDNIQFGEGFFPQPYDQYVPLGIGLADLVHGGQDEQDSCRPAAQSGGAAA